jgi:DNA-binding IclR family transcriptional regulator
MRKRNEMSEAETEVCMSTGQEPGERDSQFVTALARGLDVMRAFHPKDGPLGNQQLSERTGLPKPTVSRLTYTLSRLGYLTHLPEVGKYVLGAGVLSLGFTCLGAMGIRHIARPFMQELADYSGVSVALGSRDRLSMAYVECCRGDSAVTLALDVGSHIKLGTSAMGRAFLADLPDAERAPLFAQLAAHEGERWPAVKRGIEQAEADIAQRGFSISAGEWKSEVNAVGVPLRVGEGSLAFALNCGGPAYKMPLDRLVNDMGPRLLVVADKIRRALGAE